MSGFGLGGLRELYAHMEWADSRVWQAICQLEAHDAKLHDKLYHVHFTQRAFLSAWTGQKVSRYEPAAVATFGEIRAWVQPYYGEVGDYLQTVNEAELSRVMNVPWARMFEKAVGKPPADTTLGETIFQAANHTTYHRGQVNTRIRELGGVPPLVDYIGWLWSGRPTPGVALMTTSRQQLQRIAILSAVAAVVAAAAELYMGRSWFGPDGRFGLWEGDIWSSEQSQRLADPYSFTHIEHGFMFYGLLWLVARRLPVAWRFLGAVALEAGWEVLENSPIIIDRYRAVTISLGYVGDSILNSLSDIVMMAIGFVCASKLSLRASLILVAVMEIGLLLWVKDNLFLNMLMLIYPIEAIKQWQSAGHV